MYGATNAFPIEIDVLAINDPPTIAVLPFGSNGSDFIPRTYQQLERVDANNPITLWEDVEIYDIEAQDRTMKMAITADGKVGCFTLTANLPTSVSVVSSDGIIPLDGSAQDGRSHCFDSFVCYGPPADLRVLLTSLSWVVSSTASDGEVVSSV